MKTLLLSLTFILLSSVCFGQSKKAQIIALNNSIDSLNTVLTNTRDDSAKEIGSLNYKIGEISNEVTTLKSDLTNLQTSNIKLKTDLGELFKKNLELEAKMKDVNENNWVISNLTPFLNSGLWRSNCGEKSTAETKFVAFMDGYILFGSEGYYGGTIQNIFYNSYSKKFKIIYVNDNEMAGDGKIYEFLLYYKVDDGERTLVFLEEMLSPDYNYESIKLLTYHFCD